MDDDQKPTITPLTDAEERAIVAFRQNEAWPGEADMYLKAVGIVRINPREYPDGDHEE